MIELTKLLIANPELSRGLAFTVVICVFLICNAVIRTSRNRS